MHPTSYENKSGWVSSEQITVLYRAKPEWHTRRAFFSLNAQLPLFPAGQTKIYSRERVRTYNGHFIGRPRERR